MVTGRQEQGSGDSFPGGRWVMEIRSIKHTLRKTEEMHFGPSVKTRHQKKEGRTPAPTALVPRDQSSGVERSGSGQREGSGKRAAREGTRSGQEGGRGRGRGIWARPAASSPAAARPGALVVRHRRGVGGGQRRAAGDVRGGGARGQKKGPAQDQNEKMGKV